MTLPEGEPTELTISNFAGQQNLLKNLTRWHIIRGGKRERPAVLATPTGRKRSLLVQKWCKNSTHAWARMSKGKTMKRRTPHTRIDNRIFDYMSIIGTNGFAVYASSKNMRTATPDAATPPTRPLPISPASTAQPSSNTPASRRPWPHQ